MLKSSRHTDLFYKSEMQVEGTGIFWGGRTPSARGWPWTLSSSSQTQSSLTPTNSLACVSEPALEKKARAKLTHSALCFSPGKVHFRSTSERKQKYLLCRVVEILSILRMPVWVCVHACVWLCAHPCVCACVYMYTDKRSLHDLAKEASLRCLAVYPTD